MITASIERARFIKKYRKIFATMEPGDVAALFWDEVKQSRLTGFATARLTEWDTKTGVEKTFIDSTDERRGES